MNPDRPRIFSHLTRTRFLHIEDSLERRKLRVFIGAYEQGRGAGSTAFAFLDLDDARVVLSDLSWGKPVAFVDYKGTKSDAGEITSRVLKIRLKEEKCWIEVQNGLGEMVRGVVKPKGTPLAEVSIPLTVHEARKLAFACLAYIQAAEIRQTLLPSRSSTIQDP